MLSMCYSTRSGGFAQLTVLGLVMYFGNWTGFLFVYFAHFPGRGITYVTAIILQLTSQKFRDLGIRAAYRENFVCRKCTKFKCSSHVNNLNLTHKLVSELQITQRNWVFKDFVQFLYRRTCPTKSWYPLMLNFYNDKIRVFPFQFRSFFLSKDCFACFTFRAIVFKDIENKNIF